MTYHNYQWTAYRAADFQNVTGTYCGEFTTGSKLTVSGAPSATMQTYDNDRALNGDNGWYNDHSEDYSGQAAYVDGARVGGQMYAEQYYVLHGSDGKTYYMINIEVEGCQGTANGEYYTFYGAVPPAGVELTVSNVCNVSGCWVDYNCIGAGDTAPPNTPPHFTNVPAQGCLTIDENKGFVIDLNASDDDGDALSFAIVGGDDAHLFEIDAATGELTFKSAPDYEKPADCDGDNTYDVKVKVSDGKGGHDVKSLCVRVKDDTTEPETGVISGRFFVDADCNGSEWNDVTCNWDGAVPHAKVELLDLNGNVVATTTTDGHGNYSFEAPTGQYYVRFAAQEGKAFIDQGKGKDLGHGHTADTNDSDAGALGMTDVITLTKGGQTNVDAGVGKCLPVIGTNCVVIEAEDMHLTNFCVGDASSASGGQYAGTYSGYTGVASTTWCGESGSCDITVTAWDAPSRSWWSSASEKVSLYVNGKCVGTYALTNDNCDWRDITFKDVELNPGDKIEIRACGQNGTIGAIDKVKICCDVTDPVTGKIGDLVFLDADKDGVQDAGEAGAAGVQVKLLDAATGQVLAITQTDANGAYLFENLPAGDYKVMVSPGAAYADYVFTQANQGGDDAKDSDVDASGMTGTVTLAAGETNLDVDAGLVENTGSLAGTLFRDVNKNGVEDAGDQRVPGKTVVLFEIVNGVRVERARQDTDANGDYKFTDLSAGTYVVGFLDPQTGEVFVPADQGTDDTIDSDVTSVVSGDGFTGAINLAAGEDKTDVDAGIADPGTAKITGRLFEDTDKDGIEDAGEPGVAGVTVTLTNEDTGATQTTVTGPNGEYAFTDLDAGDYTVSFPTEVNGKKLTDSNVGSDDTVDSDADQTTGKTGVIELDIGEQSDDNDAGIVDPGTASVGDTVFFDANGNGVFDAGDSGLAGVTVQLTGAGLDGLFGTSDDITLTETTDANGAYLFDGLNAGDYKVTFLRTGAAAGLAFTTQGAAADDAVNNDSDADVVTGMTDSFSLDIGEAERDIDAGLIKPNTPPAPQDDTGKICANTELTLDVLANDSDADGDSLTITKVGGQAITEGQTVTVDGVNITLSGGKLVFDGEAAYQSLDIGEKAVASFTYTVSDGQDVGTATVDVTVCGTAETLQEICASLPKDLVGYKIKSDIAQQPYGPDAFDVALQSSDARFNGLVITDAYCADYFRLAETASDFANAPVNTANLYCATDPALANVLTNKATGLPNGADRGGETVLDNLDVISWIISQDFENKGTYTGGEVQAAIWEFTNDYSKRAADLGITVPEFNLRPGTGDAAKVAELVNLAEVAGEGFVAGAGDRVALFLDPNPDTATNNQPIVFGVDFNDIDCLC